MVNYREILRLKSLNYSQRQIASSVHSSRDTISEVLKLASANSLSWPLENSISDEVLFSIFYPERISQANRKEPNHSYIHEELAKQGVNLSLLWSEYCENCYTENTIPYMYSHFCDKYRHWSRITKATMRIKHKPGDVLQVDWAGNTIPIYDSVTGITANAYLFVAVLPCSCYAYVEACSDMKSENWMYCHIHAYSYFNGVTRILLPDNLKTGVIKNTKYDLVINRSYYEMAEYYDTAIVPARVRHPQDKALVEGTVKYASTWITAALRAQKFFSLQEISEAIKEKLEELNNRPFQKREGSRLSAYINEEKDFMKPLPNTPYEPAVWTTATVQSDYLISDGKNKYSVPYDLIGESIDIRKTRSTIEAFFHSNRIASHLRIEKSQRNPIVLPEHMTPEHRSYLSYNEDDFKLWSKSIGVSTEAVISSFLKTGKVVEQGFKACASLTKLAVRYGNKRLEAGCERALIFGSIPTIRSISTILKNGQDKSTQTQVVSNKNTGKYGITRGATYFSKGGATND